MDLSRLSRYIKDDVDIDTPEDLTDYIIMEKSELMKIQAEIDKNLKELERKKGLTADILVDFKKMSKKLQKAIDKTDRTIKTQNKLDEKMYGFGKNGAIEIHGNDVAITKDGVSIGLTRVELADIFVKMGIAKKR